MPIRSPSFLLWALSLSPVFSYGQYGISVDVSKDISRVNAIGIRHLDDYDLRFTDAPDDELSIGIGILREFGNHRNYQISLDLEYNEYLHSFAVSPVSSPAQRVFIVDRRRFLAGITASRRILQLGIVEIWPRVEFFGGWQRRTFTPRLDDATGIPVVDGAQVITAIKEATQPYTFVARAGLSAKLWRFRLMYRYDVLSPSSETGRVTALPPPFEFRDSYRFHRFSFGYLHPLKGKE